MTYTTPEWMKADLNKGRAQKFADSLKRNRFLNNLKAAAEENPVLVLMVTAAVMTAGAKLIKAHGEAKGSKAYAKQVAYRIAKGK